MVSTIHAATVPKTMQAMALAHFGGSTRSSLRH